jgi:hypothetical protein
VRSITLAYLLWWVDPLTYVATGQRTAIPVPVLAGLFAWANSLALLSRWSRLQGGEQGKRETPSADLQAAVVLVGGAVGVALLRSPWGGSLSIHPLYIVLGLALVLWAVWFLSSYLLSRSRDVAWRRAGEGLALGLLPLSFLPIEGMLWWRTYQDGTEVARKGLASIQWGLLGAVLLSSVAISLWILCGRKRDRKTQPRFLPWFLGLSVPILLFFLAYDPNLHGPLDLFHEGERLVPALGLLSGQVAYKDVVFVHGFLRDPGVALASFGLFGVSVEALRTLEALLLPLALVASYYLALAILGGRWAVLYSGLALTGFVPFFADWRIVPGLMAFVCLALYVRQRRVAWAVASALCTLLALATSFDVGVVVVISGLTLCLALTWRAWRVLGLRLLVAYVLPLVLGLFAVLAYFAAMGALGPFLDWHREILAVYRDWNGVPFPLPGNNLWHRWQIVFSPLVSVVAILILVVSVVRKKWGTWQSMVLLLLVANATLYNRALVSSHISQASHFAPLLALALVLTVWPRGRGAPAIIYASLTLFLLLPVGSWGGEGRSVSLLLEALPSKNRIEIPVDWRQPEMDRLGDIYLPPAQADSLRAILDFLGDESFYDFADQGAIYFLAGRFPATRFYATHHMITAQNQREAIADLAAARPRYVLYRSGTAWDRIAGVDRALRSFLVSEYLLDTYHYEAEVDGFAVLEEWALADQGKPLAFAVDLGYVPFLWGRDRLVALAGVEQGVEVGWDLSLSDRDGWEPTQDLFPVDLSGEGWPLRSTGANPSLEVAPLSLDPRSITYCVVRMRVAGEQADGAEAQLFWRSAGGSYREEQSVRFGVIADGEEHPYAIRLASFPSWAWAGEVTALRLSPVQAPGYAVWMGSIECPYVDELGAGGG